MNKQSKGIARARELKNWRTHRGGLPPAKDPFLSGKAGTFDPSCLQWLTALLTRNLSPATIATYRWALLRYRRWLVQTHSGKFPPLSTLVGRRKIEQFQKALLHEAASAHTRAQVIGTLTRFSAWLVRQGKLKTDPLLQIESAKPWKQQLPRALPLSLIERILTLPDTRDPLGLRDRAILELFYSSALRRKELRDLKLQDLDFHHRQVRVEAGKGGKQRLVPVGQRALSWVHRYLLETRTLLSESSEPHSPLFITGYGDAFSAGGLGHLVRKYLDQGGVTVTGSCHLLRHSCATHLLDGGASLRAIQRILGHSRLDTTAIYTHVSTRRLSAVHSQCHPHGDAYQESKLQQDAP